MDPSVATVAAVAAALGTDPIRGLSLDEASRRLRAEGPNALRVAPREPAWARLLAQLRDPLVYLLLAAIAISLAAWIIEGRHGWPVDALVIAAIVIANAVIGYVQEARAEDAVAALAAMAAPTSAVVREGEVRRVPSASLVRGDVVVLAEGDAVPADARLVEASALQVQEASLTGESQAVMKDASALGAAAALGDRLDMVFRGTVVVQGNARAIVTATGMETEMGRIAGMLEETAEEATPLQREVRRLGRMLAIAAGVIALAVMATLLAVFDVRGAAGMLAVLLLGVSLAVAAVPEGLPAILSLVLALGVQRMARRHAIVKKLSSVETLGSASVICSDKTGTLTRSEMTLQRVKTASGGSVVSGVGYAPDGTFESEAGGALSREQHAEHVVVLSGGSLAGNAALREAPGGRWEVHGDPTEVAFLVAERKLGATERRQRRFTRVAEIAFTSERKMMSTVEVDNEHGGERVVVSKGAPDVLLGRCDRVRVGLETVALDEGWRRRILEDVEALSGEALRTLGVAYRPLAPTETNRGGEDLERGLVYVGTVGIIDPPRPEAAAAIAEARRAGIRVVMITGDHPRTAARIACDLGIVPAGAAALTGRDLDGLDAAAFRQAVRSTSVFARVEPRHKMRIVDALQADGHVVAMTGDGVNDAPALKAADIGIAMAITGTEVARQAARMVLADDNFATIVVAVREGRRILQNIRKALRYLLSSNMGEVLTVFIGVAGGAALGLAGADGRVALPLLATQILWINLVTDSGPALALGVDPGGEDLMARPPRAARAPVVDRAMWLDVIGTGIVMAVVTLTAIDLYLPGGFIEGDRSLDNARTAAFTVLVLAQLFNVFNARSGQASAFRGALSNPWLIGTVALAAMLQVAVVHVEFLNRAFGTAPLDGGQWVVCIALASGVLWAQELRKLAQRRPR